MFSVATVVAGAAPKTALVAAAGPIRLYEGGSFGGTQSGGGSGTISGTREIHYDDGTTEGCFVRSGHNVYDNTGAGRCVASGIYASGC